MSVQLILYPQHYDGFYNFLSYSANPNFCADGTWSTGAFGFYPTARQYGTTAANPMLDTITNAPPTILNTWYSYSTTGSPWGDVPFPQTAGGVAFSGYTISGQIHTGVYQRMSGLTIGGVYTVAVVLPAITFSGGVGALKIEIY